jgi:hypothetical protein
MKKILQGFVLFMLLAVCSQAFAAGSCTVTGNETVEINGTKQRKYIELTCTGDGSITAFNFSPATYGVRGWYLYNVTTNPGTSAPTDNYDITLVSDGEDIAGGSLANRSTSVTQTVQLSPATLGYHMADEIMAVTIANNTANPSTIVLTFRFTSN